MIAVTHTAAAAVMRICKIFRAAQSSEGGDELKCRAWRQRADRAVDQRIAFVFLQRFPILRLDARNESIWIERRNRSHRQDVAVVWIDNDCASPAHGAQGFFGDRLDPRIEREKNVRALLRRIFPQHSVNRALGIAAQMAHARFSAQVFVHDFLDVRFPLHVPLVKRVVSLASSLSMSFGAPT